MSSESKILRLVDYSSSSEDENILSTAAEDTGKLKMQITGNKQLWPRNQTKINRERGLEYRGYSRDKYGIVSFNTSRSARMLGAACNSNLCKRSKLHHCSEIATIDREQIFKGFWNMSWEQKKMFAVNLITAFPTKRKYTKTPSQRTNSMAYHLTVGNKRFQVCKKMFLNTLGLKEKMLRVWLKSSDNFAQQKSPSEIKENRLKKMHLSTRIKDYERRKLFLKDFFNQLPKMESHYCRKDSSKLYFETTFRTKTKLYNIYKERSINEDICPLSKFVFNNILESCNYALFKPRKDECDLCSSYKLNNCDLNMYQTHRENIVKARQEKESDKAKALTGECILLCMDAQAVKLCPQLNTSASYYKTKLQIHNFTIYDLATHESSNYFWDETEGGLVASIFVTILTKYLITKTSLDQNLPIIIYSDGCGYQNRNAVLSNALLNLSIKLNVVIEQKFLEKGHTQMECDSTHSLIERKLKGQNIYLPSQFVSFAKDARRNPFPLDVQQLTHDFFLSYDDKRLMNYSSIRPGKTQNDPTVSELRCLKYNPDGHICFKVKFDEDYNLLPHRPKRRSVDIIEEPKQLYDQRLPIPKKKWQQLQDLKKYIPFDTHLYYDNIAFN